MSDLEIPQTPMQMLGVDIIGAFNETEQGYKYLLTVIDYLSGWAEAYPMKDQTAAELIAVMTREHIPRHGAPLVIVSDNGQCFKSKQWLQCAENAGIKVR